MNKFVKLLLIFITAAIFIIFVKTNLVRAGYNNAVSEASDSIQYIVIYKADSPAQTCCFWNNYIPDPSGATSCDYQDSSGNLKPGRPLSCKTDNFENALQEIKALVPVPQNKTVKLGVQFTVSYFNAPISQSEASVQELINIAEKEKMPIVIKLDGMTDWIDRPDLWNWFNPALKGYNPDNKENVEWTDWTSDAAIKISWRQWGQQERIPPAPNLGSERYKEAKKAALDRLLPIISNWYNNLPREKKYLLAGVVLENELSLWNHQHYPNGNDYYDRCPEYNDKCAKAANDPQDIPNVSQGGPSWGRQAIGYAAVKSFGIKTEGQLTQQDVNEAIKKHAEFLGGTARSYLPADKVFIHGMWNLDYQHPSTGVSYFNVVTNIVSPGWTSYGNGLRGFLYNTTFQDTSQELRNAISQNPTRLWGALEWHAVEPADPKKNNVTDPESSNSFNSWANSLVDTLRYEGNKLIVLYSLDRVRNNRSVIVPAIENAIKGAPDDPNYVEENPLSEFNFIQNTSDCQADRRGENTPTVNLAWGKYDQALGYRVSRLDQDQEQENLSGFVEKQLSKSELKYADQNVLPGRTYVYQIQAIVRSQTNKPTTTTTTVTVGSCGVSKTDLVCKPYQTQVKDSQNKVSCIDKPCQERTSSNCTADNKCSLITKEDIQSCDLKVNELTSIFTSSLGDQIEATVASLCDNVLSNQGINTDSHVTVCKQNALNPATGCLKSTDLNDLTGCVNRAADTAISVLTPGFTSTNTAPQGAAPEEVAVNEAEETRIPTEAYLQTVDGEAPLPIEGETIRFPTPKLVPEENVIRVKIVFDKPDKKGSRELYRTFKVKRTTTEQLSSSCNPDGEIDPNSWTSEGVDCTSNDPVSRGQKWSCQGKVRFAYGENCPPIEETVINKKPAYDESCWEMEKNECTGCGISRTVERYTCEGTEWFNQLRVKPGTEGQKDNDCALYDPSTLKFLRNECTGCNKARRVEGCANGVTAITQTDVDDQECADRCAVETKTSCEIEDLAFYCDAGNPNLAVYKYRDNACQIQFTSVDCKNERGQICRDGDCVNE